MDGQILARIELDCKMPGIKSCSLRLMMFGNQFVG